MSRQQLCFVLKLWFEVRHYRQKSTWHNPVMLISLKSLFSRNMMTCPCEKSVSLFCTLLLMWNTFALHVWGWWIDFSPPYCMCGVYMFSQCVDVPWWPPPSPKTWTVAWLASLNCLYCVNDYMCDCALWWFATPSRVSPVLWLLG